MPAVKPSTEARQRKRRRRRFQIEALESRRLLAAELDFGDAPDLGLGTGEGDYQTLLSDNGPRHEIRSGLFLGASVDFEPDAWEGDSAGGDDNTFESALPDDEDGLSNPAVDLTITVGSEPKVNVWITNTTGESAILVGWIDYNADGLFDNARERARVDLDPSLEKEIVTLQFPSVPSGGFGQTYARFRLSTDSAAENAFGPAADGEVEDYPVQIMLPTEGNGVLPNEGSGLPSGDHLLSDYRFGQSVAMIGDLDGNTTEDYVVGVPGDDSIARNQGAIDVLLRNTDGTIDELVKIDMVTAGLDSRPSSIEFGAAVAGLGELAKDGTTAIAVGAPREWTGDGSGAVYILFLNSNAEVVKTTEISSRFHELDSNLGFRGFGRSLAAVGDVNDDGFVDLAVGSEANDGAVHILFLDGDGAVNGTRSFASGIGGMGNIDPFGDFGAAVSRAQDINGDMIPDLAIGEPGSRTVHTLMLDVDGTLKSKQAISNDQFGYGSAIASLGRLNRDDTPDLAVIAEGRAYALLLNPDGTKWAETNRSYSVRSGTPSAIASTGISNSETGITKVVVGRPDDDTGGIRVEHVTEFAEWLGQFGPDIGEFGTARWTFGTSVASLGDLDGNGFNDLAVGDPRLSTVHILFMGYGNHIESTVRLGGSGDSFHGLVNPLITPADFGNALTTIGDLDGNGVVDLLVGAGGLTGQGSAFVLFLNADGTLKNFTELSSETNGLPALNSDDRFGAAVTSLGDIDGDGITDVAVAAPSEAIYVLLLNADGTVKTSRKFTGQQIGMGELPLSFGEDLATLGDLNGDGLTDLAVTSREAIHVLFLNQGGTVDDIATIDATAFGDVLPVDVGILVRDMTSMGDMDGDGIVDLAVTVDGRIHDISVDLLYIYLNPNGSVRDYATMQYVDDRIASVGDQTGDGVVDLARTTLTPGSSDFDPPGEIRIQWLKPLRRDDYADAPDSGEGTGPWNYRTSSVDDGPQHAIDGDIFLGDTVGADVFAVPSILADFDSDDGLPNGENEIVLVSGQPAVVTLKATNTTGRPGVLSGWIDWNTDGEFSESERAQIQVPDGTDGPVTLSFTNLPEGVAGLTYARFRLSTDVAAAMPTGFASDGEVEDYLVRIDASPGIGESFVDFGDAPIGNSGGIVSASASPQPRELHGPLRSIGDVDGNGTNDLAASVMIGGNVPGVQVRLLNSDGTVKQIEESPLSLDLQSFLLGESFTGSSDLNNDGIPDVVIGSTAIDSNAAGRLDVVFLDRQGRSIGSAVIGGASENGPPPSELAGFGTSVASIGDLNLDGHDDLAVGATGFDDDGSVFVLLMGADGVVDDYHVLTGPGDFGSSIVDAGDLNGDNVTDLLIGAPTYSDTPANLRSGAAFVVFMNPNGTEQSRVIISQSTGIPVSSDDRFGASVAAFSDVGEMGGNYIVVGAPYDNTGGMNRGAVYILPLDQNGAVTDVSKIATGLDGGPENSAGLRGTFGQTIAVMDNTNANGLPELLVGAASSDYLVQLARASAFVRYPSHDLTSNLFLGSMVDAEQAPNADDAATGDDRPGTIDDEDGLVDPSQLQNLQPGQIPTVDLYVTNQTGEDAILSGWIDFNQDDQFDESERAWTTVPPDRVGSVVTLTFPAVPAGFSGTSYARFRLSTDTTNDATPDTSGMLPFGWADDGEVEDYAVTGVDNGYELLVPAGSVDVGFGDGGIVRTSARASAPDKVADVSAYLTDGQMVVLGNAYNDVTVLRLNADGLADSTFGDRGVARHQLFFDNGRVSASSLAVDEQGRILIAGTMPVTDGSGRTDFAVTRLTATGDIDTSFGSEGFQFIEFDGRRARDPSIEIDSLGRIIVGGSAYDLVDRDTNFAVTRLTAGGMPDPEFSDDGKHHFDLGGTVDQSNSLAIDEQDRIVMVGYTNRSPATNRDLAAVRLTSAGQLDPTFSSNGIRTIDFNGKTEFSASVAIDTLGRIVLTGRSFQGGDTGSDIAVVRLTASGSPDTDFSEDGKRLIDLNSQGEFTFGLEIDDSDRIVFGYHATDPDSNNQWSVLRLTNSGDFDLSFDDDGIVSIEFDADRVYPGRLALGSSGTILVAGTVWQFSNEEDTGVARLTQNGDIDFAFSRDGRLTTDIGYSSLSSSTTEIVTHQPDGKILVVGRAGGRDDGVLAVRYLADGQVDLGFGDRGFIILETDPFTNSDFTVGARIDNEGRIIIVTNGRESNSNAGTLVDIHVYRLTPHGELDSTFGTNGRVVLDFNSQSENPADMALDSQGRIIISGYSGSDRILIRLTSDGTIDPTFDTSDSAGLIFPVDRIAIDDHDNVVLAGRLYNDFYVARFLESGDLDRSFDGDGIRNINIIDASRDSSDFLTGVTIDGFGRIVVAGYFYEYSTAQFGAAVVWLNPDGSLDVSYGDGKSSFDFGKDRDRIESISVDSLNRVIVGGYTRPASGPDLDFAVARFEPDGSIDEAFGVGGKKIIDLGENTGIITSVVVDQFDRILLAGNADSKITIVRLLSNDGEGGEYLQALLNRDYGDAPDIAPGTGPGDYNTSINDLGPVHQIDTDLFMGAGVDGEFTASPGGQANSDDITGDLEDDEDGVVDPANSLKLVGGTSPVIPVVVTNRTKTPAILFGWIDTDANGTFDLQSQRTVPPGSEGDLFELAFSEIPVGFNGTSYARFRLSTDTEAASVPTGFAADGEVEDYQVSIESTLLSINNVSQLEGAVGPTPYEFTVTRSGSFAGEVSVDFETIDGTATVDNNDYVATSGTLTFLDGESSKTIIVNVQGDTHAEPSEKFLVQLSNVVGNAKLIRSEGTGTILDTGGFVLHGIDSYDFSGSSVSDAGDINNDGYDDFIIGAYGGRGEANTNSYAGESYVVFGGKTFTTSLDFGALDGTNGFTLYGIDLADFSGLSVSGAGDVNNDGYDDLLIGAFRGAGETNTNSFAGESYVVFGGETFAASIDLDSLDGTNGFVLHGIDASDRSGYSVSGAGDVNNDGYDDVIIGAYFGAGETNTNSFAGESYVVFGGETFAASLDLGTLDGTNGFVLHGIDASDRSGYSVSGAGDVNNDGYDDLLIGAFRGAGETNTNSFAGESYVVFGGETFAASIDLDLLDGMNGFVLHGIDPSDSSGHSVSGAGDVNNDGYDDFIIGAYGGRGEANTNSFAGESYVVFGGETFAASIDLDSLDGTNGFVLHGNDASDRSGYSVSGAGDVNNDGYDDVIIGAEGGAGETNTNSFAGESYVVFGGETFAASIDLDLLDGMNGFVLHGIDPFDISGHSVSGAGDVNDDGYDDVIIGAGFADTEGGRDFGESYVVFGAASFPAQVQLSRLSPGLGDWIQEARDEQEPVLSIATDADNLASTLNAIEQLDDLDTQNGEALEISIDLAAGTYSGETIELPDGITVRINGSDGTTWIGASPALTLVSGNMIVEDFTFSNATDAPTILVQGGNLKLRNSTIEESTVGDQPAIEVLGGSIDLGSVADPGNNTININGPGSIIRHTGSTSIPAVGNVFLQDGSEITDGFALEEEIQDYFEATGSGAVVVYDDRFFDRTKLRVSDFDLQKLTADLGLSEPSFEILGNVAGIATLLSDSQTVRFAADSSGLSSFTFAVVEDNATQAVRTVQLDVTNIPPEVDLGGDVAGNEGDTFSFGGTYSDPGDTTVHMFAWTVSDESGVTVSAGTEQAFDFVPPDNGTYTIHYSVTDGLGETGSDQLVLVVSNVAPTPLIDSISATRAEGTAIVVVGSATDPAGQNDTVGLAWTVIKTAADGTMTDSYATVTGTNWSFTPDDNGTYRIELTASDEDGDSATASETIVVVNVPPNIADLQSDLVENSAVGTQVGSMVAADPGTDTVTYRILPGGPTAGFEIDANSGLLTVTDPTFLDYETATSLSLQIEASDEDGGSSVADLTINLLNQPSLSGSVYVDVNEDGIYQANEPGIDDVEIRLTDLQGNPILDPHGDAITAITSDGGFYFFEDLDPGEYQIAEQQPSGVTDGAESLGSLGGTVVSNDVMQLELARTDAHDYTFAEIGGQLTSGESAGIGFWQSKHGQELITAGGTSLAGWLTDRFDNVFGNLLAHASGQEVADFYRNQLFKGTAQQSSGPAKVDAQFMATAFNVYFTNSSLSGSLGSAYGFAVTDTGLGNRVVNVGSSGSAFDTVDGDSLTVMQLLSATNALTDADHILDGFASIYDLNGDGILDGDEINLRMMANDLYAMINEQ